MMLKPLATLVLFAAITSPLQTPRSLADELLAADRSASSASAKTTLIAGLTAMFAQDVVMQAPGVGFARGLAAATEALKANADNATAKVDWIPVRAGVSADGLQGFTFGYMTLHRADGTTSPLKYLAYWVKRDGRWQVAAYKRRLRAAGDVPMTTMAASLPSGVAAPTADPATLQAIEQGLIAAEKAFSDEAQKIGLGAAFVKFGSADAMNMGGPNDVSFVIGSEAIGKAVGAGQPASGSSVKWSADSVIVASSGDLGVTIGYIRPNVPAGTSPAPAPAPIPFFTIWRRAAATAPWRYIAE
jgi:hypothetical protein